MPTPVGRVNIGVLRDTVHKEFSRPIGSGKLLPKTTMKKMLQNNTAIQGDKHLKDVANAIIHGKDTHTVEKWKVEKFLKSIGKIAVGSEKVPAKLSFKGKKIEKYGAKSVVKEIEKLQVEIEKPVGPTEDDFKQKERIKQANLRIHQLREQQRIAEEQGEVLGDRFVPQRNKTSVNEQEKPTGSIMAEAGKDAQSSISDVGKKGTTATPSASDSGQAENTPDNKENTNTAPPSIAAGGSNEAAKGPDTTPAPAGAMKLISPEGEEIKLTPEAKEKLKKVKDDSDLPNTEDVDIDLPF